MADLGAHLGSVVYPRRIGERRDKCEHEQGTQQRSTSWAMSQPDSISMTDETAWTAAVTTS